MSAKASAKGSKKATGAKPAKKAAPAKAAAKTAKKPAPRAKPKATKPTAAEATKRAKPAPASKPKPAAKKPKAAKPAVRPKAKPAAKKPAAAAPKRPRGKPAKSAKQAAKPAAKSPAAKRAGAAPAPGALRARVLVYPRREVLDPQGKAIRSALAGIGFDQVEDVRAGKSFEIILSAKAARAAGVGARAHELLTAMCEKLLANPVVEDYAIELPGEEVEDGEGGPPE